ncbi:MAG: inaA protein [Deltaproteobacteria bacterium]|nr:inaA protein [Candidatus Anaeroferrophillus wilburensis]
MKYRHCYSNPHWLQLLQDNGLNDFDTLWDLEHDWFEPPNRRRGGWSGVCRLELKGEGGSVLSVFMKRQENHMARTLRHPFRGIPTSRKELLNLIRFRAAALPVPEIIYGADRVFQGRAQGILITRELTGYQSLDELLREWRIRGLPETFLAQLLFPPLSGMIRNMHQQGFRHNCLYGKHIFVRLTPPPAEICSEATDPSSVRVSPVFIDLEKVRFFPLKQRNIVRDLGQLHRHTDFSHAQWQHFIDTYLAPLPEAAQIRARLGKQKKSRSSAERVLL